MINELKTEFFAKLRFGKELSTVIEKAKEQDFSVSIDEEDEKNKSITFSKESPAGQDFSFTVSLGESLTELEINVHNYYDSYDVSEETYLWLDNTGHGKNGAPYDMEDVLNDMKACEQYILDIDKIILDLI